MKLARILVPVSILALVAMMIAALINKEAVSGDQNQAAVGLALFFVYILTMAPLLLFIPFGVALLICELCLLIVRNPIATMIAIIVLKCILLPVVLYVAVMMGNALLLVSALYGALMIGGAVLYGLSLIAMFVAFFKERSRR